MKNVNANLNIPTYQTKDLTIAFYVENNQTASHIVKNVGKNIATTTCLIC